MLICVQHSAKISWSKIVDNYLLRFLLPSGGLTFLRWKFFLNVKDVGLFLFRGGSPYYPALIFLMSNGMDDRCEE